MNISSRLKPLLLTPSSKDFINLGMVQNAFQVERRSPAANVRNWFPTQDFARSLADHYRTDRSDYPQITIVDLPDDLSLSTQDARHLQLTLSHLVANPKAYSTLKNIPDPWRHEHPEEIQNINSSWRPATHWHNDGIVKRGQIEPLHHASYLYLPDRNIRGAALEFAPVKRTLGLTGNYVKNTHDETKILRVPTGKGHRLAFTNLALHGHRTAPGMGIRHPVTNMVMDWEDAKRLHFEDNPTMLARNTFLASRPLGRHYFKVPDLPPPEIKHPDSY